MSGKQTKSTTPEGHAGSAGDDRSVAAKLFAILDAFTAPSVVTALTLTAISHRAGVPLSTTHRLVAEWVKWGGLTRQDDGRYEPSLISCRFLSGERIRLCPRNTQQRFANERSV
ncbi:hypothetical protein E3O06_06770 [Cryobacterium glaciale]|uniref:HTH iclR-type domain-containing protein n=1 Tax=Cryobacterium glaciale TaxID=1259145 RepID=A0A4R8V0C0_9MICO|nr:helix-turn-helix domain-containing protein [Cryobacterium glaciale]TFB75031.1 hypothetical protein E3O06_06770 [Cryobacterium glaciale]